MTGTRITAEHYQLGAVEQVRQLRRVHFRNLDVRAHDQLQVRQHGVADLAVQAGRLGLDVLELADVGADRPAAVREPGQRSPFRLGSSSVIAGAQG